MNALQIPPPINTTYQQTLSTRHINTPYQPTLTILSFIHCIHQPFSQVAEIVDIYIDRALNLPENCTVSRVSLRFVCLNVSVNETEATSEIVSCHAMFDSYTTAPIYSFKVTCVVGGTEEATVAFNSGSTITPPGSSNGVLPPGDKTLPSSSTPTPESSFAVTITALGEDHNEMGFVTKIMRGAIKDPTTTAILRIDTIDR